MKSRILLLCLLICFSGCLNHQRTLRIYSWADYISPEAVRRFEERYQCRVLYDSYDSNETMYAKLKAGAEGYDIIIPSNYFVEILIQQKMLEKIDKSKLSLYSNINEGYLDMVGNELTEYSVPYMITIVGIGYRKDRLETPPTDWDIFSDKRLTGRMTLLSDIREALGAGLKYHHFSANSIDPDEITTAANQLIAWRSQLAKFENEQYKNGLATSEFIVVQGYTSDIVQVMLEDPNVGCVFPSSGTTSSMDLLAIPRGAREVDLAHAFINFMLEPEIAALNMDTTSTLSPISSAYTLIREELMKIPEFIPSEEVWGKSELIKDLGDHIKLYIEAWRRVLDEW